MVFLDCGPRRGVITSVCGKPDDVRRLADMGLIGASYTVRAERGGAMLVDYGDFAAVTSKRIARCIEVKPQ